MKKFSEEKKKQIKKISVLAFFIIIAIILLLLIRCGGCSGKGIGEFSKGHKYNSEYGYYYDDEDLLRNEWEKCARMLPEGNKHTTNYYINFPWKGDWARNRTGNEYVDTELLKKFGYDVKFIKLNKDENNAIKKVNKTTKTRIYL